jgi:hypothetical protein
LRPEFVDQLEALIECGECPPNVLIRRGKCVFGAYVDDVEALLIFSVSYIHHPHHELFERYRFEFVFHNDYRPFSPGMDVGGIFPLALHPADSDASESGGGMALAGRPGAEEPNGMLSRQASSRVPAAGGGGVVWHGGLSGDAGGTGKRVDEVERFRFDTGSMGGR